MKTYAYIIAPILGWVVAQGIKFMLSLRKDGISVYDTVQSGGMPSSHTAFMVSLATAIGFGEGFNTAIFALAAAITGIVVYDSMGVRRTTGDQTKAIEKISKSAKVKINIHSSDGHTPIQVAVGAIIGIVVGLIAIKIL